MLYVLVLALLFFLITFFLVRSIVEGVKGAYNIKSIVLTALLLLALYFWLHPEYLPFYV